MRPRLMAKRALVFALALTLLALSGCAPQPAPEEQAEDFEAKLTEATAGRAVLHRSKTVYYGLAEGEMVLFEK